MRGLVGPLLVRQLLGVTFEQAQAKPGQIDRHVICKVAEVDQRAGIIRVNVISFHGNGGGPFFKRASPLANNLDRRISIWIPIKRELHLYLQGALRALCGRLVLGLDQSGDQGSGVEIGVDLPQARLGEAVVDREGARPDRTLTL